MGCFPSGIFWGVFFVLIGLSIIARAVFHIHIPIFKIFFAFLFIYIGVRILIPGHGCKPWRSENFFRQGGWEAQSGPGEYNTVFGRRDVDLTGVVITDKNVPVEVNTVFGSGRIKIRADVPARITVITAFAATRLPDGAGMAFGSHVYRTRAFREGAPCLEVQASVVFGGLEVIEN